ncbi:hypothetical protein [Amycolatopsis sp. BJA-103]|uniref:hypothetical protein n=1 Tax=Amycolatopsis sp. BJA-103 TaxID=1911175 RepID=UPI000C7946D4|nr:hypothetical protein [Amycolatopsis sp. BJA-103]AUI59217.1 hypothetical protein BKN51_13995 [Amycolatopsis sp. BJA-103]PNE17336.1 hypothetical protein B1H26_20530 [Amycolatopsis sp. BJA-103]
MTAALDRVRAVADAVLYEGYLLYPYRASAAKNQVRFQWGVLTPPAYAAGGTGEHEWSQAELIAEPAPDGVLRVLLRFLQLQKRVVEVAGRPVPSATVDGVEYTTWEEAVEREVDTVVPFSALRTEIRVPFQVGGGEDVEQVRDDTRLVRRRAGLSGELRIRAVDLPDPFGGLKLRLRVENTSGWAEPEATRPDALAHSLIAAHALLSTSDGHFLSSADPPEWAARVTEECVNERLWPVLVGDTVLCTPIILNDHPEIAEESPGTLYDGLEIDEILTLRTMTLTDEEKRQARATDARAAELLDRVDGLSPDLLDRLHGTIRYLRSVTGTPEPEVEPTTVTVGGVAVGEGSRVRLRPVKRADAHDMFLAGRVAVVRAVLFDVDDVCHLAVTLEDDLGSDLYAQHGRYRYFGADEVEPL